MPALLTALPRGSEYDDEANARRRVILDAIDKSQPDKEQIVPALARILADKGEPAEFQAAAFRLLRKTESNFHKLVPQLADDLDHLGRYICTTPFPGPGGQVADPPACAEVREVLAIFQALGPKAHQAVPALIRLFNKMEEAGASAA